MIREWGGPFAIKGVMSAADAKMAHSVGASAVMLSNHGGRQLDFSPAPFDVLKEVLDAVGGQIEVIVDGGIRRGVHILKAMALGATACSAGRPYLYGLGAGGEAGATRALKLLRAELERDMALIGAARLADLRPDMLRRVGAARVAE
jgi:L-lactate dehydrogenase (cytochrome)